MNHFIPKVWESMVHSLGVYFLFYLRKYGAQRNILYIIMLVRYCIKLLSTEDYGFRPSSTDVDRGTTSLNTLKMSYFCVCFYIFGVQTVSEIVCYYLSGLEVWLLHDKLNGKIYKVSISGEMRGSYSMSWQIEGNIMQIHHKYT